MMEPSLIAMFALIALTGCSAGFLSGILGVGGGLVIVPVLYYIFTRFGFSIEIALHIAIGTSLATIVVTQMRSALGHRQRGAFNVVVWRYWALPIMIGALLGGFVAGLIAGRVLAFIFAGGLFLVACVVIYRSLRDMDNLSPPRFAPTSFILYPTAFLSGLFSAIAGIGGATFNVTAMTLIFRMHIREAIGTSAGLGVLIGLCGATMFALSGLGVADRIPYSFGYIHLPSLLLIIPFTLLCSPLGVYVAHQLPQKHLQIIFSLMLMAASVLMFYEGLTAV